MQTRETITRALATLTAACGLAFLSPSSRAEDWTMWGGTPNRNMVSKEKNAPTEFDAESGKNMKWIVSIGSQSYGNPVIANGFVFVGTNNEAAFDKNFTKDAGVLAAFDEKSGKFLWQALSPKLAAGRVNDWPFQGICCSPLIENNLLWYTTSRCETVCYDISPMMAGEPPKQVWKVDMMGQLGVFPHNMTSCSPVASEDMVFIVTGNGVDETHRNIPAPQAPSMVAFDKRTGAVKWQSNVPGENILHGQWSSPALATVNGQQQVIAPLGDGWIYSFDAKSGEIVWKFDSNLKNTIYPRTRNELIATPVIVNNKMYIANGQDPEHGEGPGHLWCVDITKKGDISKELPAGEADQKADEGEELLGPAGAGKALKGKPNPNSGVVWEYKEFDANNDKKIRGAEKMNRTISTVAVHDGLVFAPDFSGFLHCLDAEKGTHYWTYDMEAAMWGSPLVVDGKVYLCDEDGDVAIFEATKDARKPIAEQNLGNAIYGSPVFANGVLYIMAKDKIYAIQQGAEGVKPNGRAADANK
jgi:outer membrane protein assembly factor BamB